MKKTIAIRNNVIYIHATKDKVRYRFSTKLKATKENQAYVLKHYEALLEEFLESIKPKEFAKESFASFAQKYLKTKTYLKEQTYKGMRYHIEFLNKHFGEIPIASIKRENIQEFYEFLYQRSYTKEYARIISIVLDSIFKYALDCEIISKNPFFKHSLKNLPHIKERIPFSYEEAKEMIEASKSLEEEFMFCFLTTAFWTGMRSGELFALKWENVDFENRKIKVEASMQQNGKITTPKNISSFREVEMLSPVFKALKEYQQKSGQKSSLVFMHKGKSARTITPKIFKALQEKIGLEPRVLYTTRHTFASVMLQKGEEQLWVSKMLGHKNLNITLGVYAKFIAQRDKRRAVFLEEQEEQELDLKLLGEKNQQSSYRKLETMEA